MRRELSSAILLGIALLSIAPADAAACTCMQKGASCQAAWEASAVFSSEVIRTEDVSVTSGSGMPTIQRLRVHLRVLEAFRGDVQPSVQVMTGKGGGDCGFSFVVGKQYLVYASDSAQGYQTGICQRTQDLDKAAEDLTYLRAIGRTPDAMASIIGAVTHIAPDRDGQPTIRTAFAGAQIVATGEDGRIYRGVSGADGRYAIPLPTGTYRIAVEVPSTYFVRPFMPRFQRVVVRDARGCADVPVVVQANGRIAGRVRDADGGAIVGLTIEAQSVRPPGSPSRRLFSPTSTLAVTDRNGEYEIDALHPGNYTVGVYAGRRLFDKDPDVRVLFDAARAASLPDVVSLSAGERMLFPDVTLDGAASMAPISGTVRLPDGRPAVGAKAYLFGEGATTAILNAPAIVGADGTFIISARVGRRYRIVAELLLSDNGRTLLLGEPAPFEVSDRLPALDIQLVRR